MKRFIILISLLAAIQISFSQNIEDLTIGSDSTIEVVTWNIEWFPKNGQTTVDYVSQVIEYLDADILALQEIDDTNYFKQMVDNLEGYDHFIESSYFAGLAYIYKSDLIQINDLYEIYTTYPYWSPFPRSPVVMEFTCWGQEYVVINNHYKCCGDGYLDYNDEDDEEYRRYTAMNLLKEYIDANFADKKVILVGDLNDEITDDMENNVFQNVLNDPNNYLFADMPIAEGSSSDWSYPTWPSHLDHVLITNEIFDNTEFSDYTIQTVCVDNYMGGGWDTYEENISDHRPVAIVLSPDLVVSIGNGLGQTIGLTVYPNPVTSNVTFQIDDFHELSEIVVYSAAGQLVGRFPMKAERISMSVDEMGWEPGLYFVSFGSNGQTTDVQKMIIEK